MGGVTIILFVFSTYWPQVLLISAVLGGVVVATDLAIMTLIQNVVADEYRARVISIALAISVGIPAIGSLAIGFLAEYIGLQFAMSLSGIIVLIAALFIGAKILNNASGIESTTPGTDEVK